MGRLYELCKKIIGRPVFCENDSQYSNLNLNQNHKCPILIPVQTFSKTNKDTHYGKGELLQFTKILNQTALITFLSIGYEFYWTAAIFKLPDPTVSDYNEGQGNIKAWNKSSDLCSNRLKLNGKEKEKAENQWKRDNSSLNNSKSTLSLHITAFENSVALDSNAVKYKSKKEIVTAPTFVTQSLFEFSRQQSEKVIEPEVSQFRASQRLVSPNDALTNDQQNVSVLQQQQLAPVLIPQQQQQQQFPPQILQQQPLRSARVSFPLQSVPNVDPEDENGENEEEAALNAQTYASTNRILIGLILQIICVICASFPVISALYKFLRFQFISDGFFLEFGPVMAIGLALAISLMASVWQFATILSFRSIPSAMKHSKNGFLSVLIVGLILFLQFIIFSIILFSTNSNWEEPIKKNFNILVEAALNNAEAAEELNLLQLRFDCCGSTPNVPLLPSRFASFQPYFNNFHPHHLNPVLHKTQNLPFSCCKRDSPLLYCFHLNMSPAINQNYNFQTFPSLNFPREEALSTLNYGTEASCPEKIFESIKSQLFIYPAISFLVVGIICLIVTTFGGISLWCLRKSTVISESQKSVRKSDIPEMPKEDVINPVVSADQISPLPTAVPTV